MSLKIQQFRLFGLRLRLMWAQSKQKIICCGDPWKGNSWRKKQVVGFSYIFILQEHLIKSTICCTVFISSILINKKHTDFDLLYQICCTVKEGELFPLLRHDASFVIKLTSVLIHFAVPIHCVYLLHMSASHWLCPCYPLEALSNLSGLAYTQLPMPPSLFCHTCAIPPPLCGSETVCASSRYDTWCGPTCHYCDMHASPVRFSNPAGTCWLNRRHADRQTVGGVVVVGGDHSY